MPQLRCKKKNAKTRCSQYGITRGCSKGNFAANGEGEEPALFGVVGRLRKVKPYKRMSLYQSTVVLTEVRKLKKTFISISQGK